MDQRDALEPGKLGLEELQVELKALRQQVAALVALLELQEAQLSAHESSIARLDRILMELLTGRTWRTLSAAGKLIGKLAPSRVISQKVTVRSGSYLVCDEPKANDGRPRSGKISVRGWCL